MHTAAARSGGVGGGGGGGGGDGVLLLLHKCANMQRKQLRVSLGALRRIPGIPVDHYCLLLIRWGAGVKNANLACRLQTLFYLPAPGNSFRPIIIKIK